VTRRRVRLTPMAAAALGPEAVAILQADLGARAQKIQDEARAHAPRGRGPRPSDVADPLPVIRVASERLDQPRALPPA